MADVLSNVEGDTGIVQSVPAALVSPTGTVYEAGAGEDIELATISQRASRAFCNRSAGRGPLSVTLRHPPMSAIRPLLFSNRPWGSSAFRLSTTTVSMSLTGSCFSTESAPRPFHHGISKTRWNNLLGGLAVRRTVGPSGHANSPHPSSREGHHSTARWSSSVLLLD
jgi:hypothetical protein